MSIQLLEGVKESELMNIQLRKEAPRTKYKTAYWHWIHELCSVESENFVDNIPINIAVAINK